MTDQKVCTKCHELKDIDQFSFQNKSKGIRQPWCKSCNKAYKKEYYEENKDTIAEKGKTYREENKEKIFERWQLYYENNKEDILLYQKTYYEENREDKLAYALEYRNEPDNQERISQYNKEYREENIDELAQYIKEYRINNKDKLNEHIRERKAKDITFKLRTKVSSYISKELKKSGTSKINNSCLKYLPYTIQQLKDHLEKQFEPWMSWNNYGVYDKELWNDSNPLTWTWNIDHIIPRADLPYSSMEDDNFKKCWELNNLRPYSAKQNMIDGTTRARHGKSNKRS